MQKEGNHKEGSSAAVTAGKSAAGKLNRNFFLHIHASRVHVHSMKPTYTFGLGLILGFLFLVMVFTGVVLMVYYTPSAEHAYSSVKDIVFVVPGGRIIRNMHRWASQGMIIVVFLHLVRTFYTGSYLGGRSLNWVIGVVLFILILLSNFSGYLLPWDQLAYWAVTIGSNIAASARELTDLLGITSAFDPGGFLKKLLIGGETVGQPALSRFFALHVIFLPLSMLILMGIHFWRIRKDGGLTRPQRYAGDRGTENRWPAWPVLMWTELAVLLVTVLIVFGVALLADAPLLEHANPAHPENPAKSPWYFLGIQEMVSYSAFSGGWVVPILYLVFLFSIPYRDREDRFIGEWFSGEAGRRLTGWTALGALFMVLVQLAVMIRFGGIRDWYPEAPQWLVMLCNPATFTAAGFIVASEITRRRTGSTRMASLVLFTASLVALVVFTVVGIWFRGPNWVFYWSSSQWPVL
jgi:quinol-cytochrome oxidoreductase complex cytochrome b subunit